MAQWTLADIRQSLRRVAGRLSTSELTNSQLDRYINRFVQYIMPAEMKLERNLGFYEFITSSNEYLYDAPTGFTNFIPPMTVDNQEILWYQDPSRFFAENPITISRSTIGTGDGTTTAFTTTLQFSPLWPDTTTITDNTETFEDTNTAFSNSPVTLTGSLGGTATINYETGVISVTFNSAPADGQPVYVKYSQFIAGRPTAVLWYDNQFRFFTIPDTIYKVRVQAYSLDLVVTSSGQEQEMFTSATDRPLLDEWGPVIVYGTAREVVAEFGQMGDYQVLTELYRERLNWALRRSHQNLLNTRSTPQF